MIVYLITTTFFISQGLCNVNVALSKTATDCYGENYPGLVDGRMDTSVIVNETCRANNIVINLNIGGPFFVHYVNLVPDDCNEMHLVSFEVRLLKGKICGRYHNKDGKCSTYRVNCIEANVFSSAIVVQLNFPIRLKEIEVFTLASGKPFQDILIFYGCFKDFQSDKDSDKNNLDECVLFCRDKSYLFAAIGSTNCHCSSKVFENLRVVQSRDPDDQDCSSDDKYYSVYILRVQLPHRYSCVENLSNLSIAFSSQNMSIENCMKNCDDSQFAVLETFSTSLQCSCDNGTFDKSQSDQLTRCGTTQKNYLIYATCYDGITEKTKCNNFLMHCNFGWNMYGVCKGGCKKGFDGEQCLEHKHSLTNISDLNQTDDNIMTRPNDTYITNYTSATVSSYNNDTTYDNEMTRSNDTYTTKYSSITVGEMLCSFKNACGTANTKCVVTGSTFKCVCEYGYYRDNLIADCHDIDECSYSPCNLLRSTCQNQEGTFECSCRSGYVKLSQDTCSMHRSSLHEQEIDFGSPPPVIFVILIPFVAIILMLSLKMFISNPEID